MIKKDFILVAEYIVLNFQDKDEKAQILQDQALAVVAGKVAALGPTLSLQKLYPEAEIRQFGHAILMPGLINAHTHLPMTVFRGLADDLPLMEWLSEHIWPVEKRLTEDMIRYGSMLACAEMIRTGTTAFMDMYMREDLICRTVESIGLRGVYGEGISLFPTVGCKDPSKSFDLVRELYKNNNSSPITHWSVAPHAVYSTNPVFLEQAASLADELGLPLHIHLAETLSETQECLKQYGVRPVELCHMVGVLGPKTSIAHGVDLTDAELDLLKELDVKVVHNPKSNLKLASGIARVPEMLKRGISVGIGTDGAASNNCLNMFSELNYCALMHKGLKQNPMSVPAGKALHMATKGSALALHQPELGSLQPGSPADLIAIDLSSPNLNPMHDPVSCLAYATSGHEVCFSMVDGRVLYEYGKFTSFDYSDLLKEASSIGNWIKSLK